MKNSCSMGIEIVDHKIELSSELEAVDNEAKNVVKAMVRTTKFSDSPNVTSIYFETYEDMARDLMEKIKSDAAERFHISEVSVTHRVGHVPLGEYAFLVSVSARRIDDAFNACKFIVDELNSELPVWKYEVKDSPEKEE